MASSLGQGSYMASWEIPKIIHKHGRWLQAMLGAIGGYACCIYVFICSVHIVSVCVCVSVTVPLSLSRGIYILCIDVIDMYKITSLYDVICVCITFPHYICIYIYICMCIYIYIYIIFIYIYIQTHTHM